MKRVFFISPLFASLLFLMLSSFSCEKEKLEDDLELKKGICDISDPIEELEWLKDHIKDMTDDFEKKWGTIKYFEHNGNAYFEFGYCHPAINYQASYRNCKGEAYDKIDASGDFIPGHPDSKWVWCGTECDCKD